MRGFGAFSTNDLQPTRENKVTCTSLRKELGPKLHGT